MNTARPLGADPHTQGAGLIRALVAARTELVISPGSLSFGRAPLGGSSWGSRRSLRVVNLSTAARRIRLSVAAALPAGTDLNVSPSDLTLAPDDSGDVSVMLAVDLSVPVPEAQTLAYTGDIVAESDTTRMAVPFTFAKGAEITLEVDRPDAVMVLHDRAGHFSVSGARTHRLIPYDEQFRMMTLPTTYKETATVSPGKGVRLNYLYYWADAFRDPLVERTRVPVRYDPHDVGIAYAFVHHQWVRCTSEHYRIFRGHSEAELLLVAAELQQRRRKLAQESSITARRLAMFLTSVEAEEQLLAQRLRDAAVKQALEGMAGAEADPGCVPRVQRISGDSLVQDASGSDDATCAASAADCYHLLPEY